MAEAAVAVAALLQKCNGILTADELKVVQSHQNLIVEKELVSSDMISQLSFEQLVTVVGLTPGTAAALKKVFPSAAGGICMGGRHTHVYMPPAQVHGPSKNIFNLCRIGYQSMSPHLLCPNMYSSCPPPLSLAHTGLDLFHCPTSLCKQQQQATCA